MAAVALQDYEEAIRFAGASLVANPQDGTLWNNLAFSYAQSGKLKEAEDALARIPSSGLGASTEIAKLATAGLIEFRKGNTEAGRALYRDAIDRARAMSRPKLQALALVNLALEELLVATAEAVPTKALALEACRAIQDQDIQVLVRRLQEFQGARQP